MSEITRRQLAGIAIGPLGAIAAAAVSPAGAQTALPASSDWFAQAAESKRKAAAALAFVEVGMAVEPAFEFKP